MEPEANVDVFHAEGRFTTTESNRQRESQACRYSYSRSRDTVQVLLRITQLFPDKDRAFCRLLYAARSDRTQNNYI